MKRSILAVDDELHMLRLLEQLISNKTPYHIVTTHNALEVPAILEKNTFDVIITDLRMPGLTGMDILRRIHDEGRPEQLIMITAFGAMETAMETLSLGASDYITKPFTKERLLKAIDIAMKRRDDAGRAAVLNALLQKKSYSEAERLFKKVFLRDIAETCKMDRNLITDRSGLSYEEIDSILKDVND